ncbi:MAG: response regulator transcription factor [Alphaproteobacteria bacterium]|nr:response regulator transcription factor [Alphaproteobacteria bacterium]
MTATAVFLVGKDDIFREGLRSLLARNGFTLSGEYGSIAELMQVQEEDSAGSLIIHVDDEEGDLAEKALRLRGAFIRSRIVVVGGRTEMPVIMTVFSAGIDGYLRKDISCEALLGSLRLVAAGEKVYPTVMLGSIGHQAGKAIANDAGDSALPNGKRLSRQEMRIVRCLANGDPNKVIAQYLNISETTVKVHVRTILRKMGARNRTQAALLATLQGLVGQAVGQQLRMNV